MAHQMAMVSDKVTAEVVEATEFMELAQKYYVYGVPKTIVNDKVMFDGAVPEPIFLSHVLRAFS